MILKNKFHYIPFISVIGLFLLSFTFIEYFSFVYSQNQTGVKTSDNHQEPNNTSQQSLLNTQVKKNIIQNISSEFNEDKIKEKFEPISNMTN
jgi:hypothetical protein